MATSTGGQETAETQPASDAPSPKRLKTNTGDKTPAVNVPQSVVVQFVSSTGELTGPQIDLPSESTPTQMEMLINELRSNQEGKVRAPLCDTPLSLMSSPRSRPA